MSRPVGRHRAPRRGPLHRPAVAATATLSALALSAAGYASASKSGSDLAGATLSLAPATSAGGVVVADPAGARTALQKAAAARGAAAKKAHGATAKRLSDSRARSAEADRLSRRAIAEKMPELTNLKSVAAPAPEAPKAAPAKNESTEASTSNESSTPVAQQRASRSADRPAAPTGDPRSIARSMLASYGWSSSQFGCLEQLWHKESGWSVTAANPSSGAYGIPQSLPGSKMASAGADWRSSAATQIKWGLGYIQGRYGSPCSAWAHSQSVNWY